MKKYEWLPTSNAPEIYPTEIFDFDSHFYLEDGSSVYIPTSVPNCNGWGNSGSTHTQGEDLKALPVKMEITWASFKENKFYTGNWDMPIDTLKKLFEKGTIDWRTGRISNYNEIIVNCAPGGIVVVWVYGNDQQIEVARFQAKETQFDIKKLSNNPEVTQKGYFEVMGKLKPEFEEEFKKKGIQYDIYDIYRKKYTWRARVEIPSYSFERTMIKMYNGEEETLFNGVDRQNDFRPRAIPKFLSFAFKDNKEVITIFQVKDFNEDEIMSLFQEADANKPIEIILRMNADLSNRRLIFKQGEKEIPIKKIDVENMWKYKG